MNTGDLVYHVDDWTDKKPIVGLVLGFNSHNKWNSAYRVKVVFSDDNKIEWWPPSQLRFVDESR